MKRFLYNENTRFRILQYNIKNELSIITILLMNSAIQNINILIIQKPNYNSNNKLLYNFNINVFYLTHKIKVDIKICFYINKRFNFDN